MNVFRWHLWREWREHRITLLMLFLILPVLGLGIARVPPKAVLGDPLIQSGAALTFVVVLLVAVGGELLGLDRRGPGLRWLERLPSGLPQAFQAKLAFLGITTTVAAVYGLGVARSIALLRGVEPWSVHWEPLSFIAGVSLVLWTFACSAWALRGGVSILAATSVLALVGYPAWRVLSEGYSLSVAEVSTGGVALVTGALVSATLAFLRGGRLGGGTGRATLLGLAPVVPLLALSTVWSLDRLEQRERIDPLAPEFAIHSAWVSEDGRTALVGCYMWNEGWRDRVPNHVLRVDLASGDWERIGGRNARFEEFGAEVEKGPAAPDTSVWVGGDEEPAEARVFSASRAEPIALEEVAARPNGWVTRPAGLGWLVLRGPFRPLPVLFDPYHRVSVPLKDLDLSSEKVFLGPERWLVLRDLTWFDCAPGERELVPAAWMSDVLEPGPMLPDGRMFGLTRGSGSIGYCLIDPSKREVVPLGRAGENLSHPLLRTAYLDHRSVFLPGEHVLLDTADGRFLFDETSLSLRPVLGETWEACVRSFPDGTVILVDEKGRLVRQDLVTNAREILFSAVH